MGILNKEVRITAVDAGYTSTIDRISEETKRKLSQDNTDTGIGELIEEAEQKFKSVGDQVRYIAEELNKLKVGKDVFANERARIADEYNPQLRKAFDTGDTEAMNKLNNRRRSALNQVDKDEEAQTKVNQDLAEVLGKLKEAIEKQGIGDSKKKRPTVDQVDHEDKQQRKWYDFLNFQKKGDRLTEEEEASLMMRKSRIGQRAGGVATQLTGNSAVGESVQAAISGVGGVSAIIAAVGSILLANNQFTNKSGKISGMTSLTKEELFNHYMFNTTNGNMLSTDLSQLGSSTSEMMDYLGPTIRARGSRQGALSVGMRQLRLEKGFGLDNGSISRGDIYSRADNTAQDASSQIMLFIQEARTGKMFGFNSGDFSQLGEKIDQFGRLTALQAQQSEIADQRMSMKMIEAGGEIGGSFADNRAADQWSKLNSAVTNPQGNFRQAYMMNRLHNANPGDSYFDIRKRMERGIFGDGNLQALLGGVTPQGESKEAMDDYYSRIQSLTGLSFSASEMLGKKIHNDKTFLSRYSRGDKKAMNEMNFIDDQGRNLQQRGGDNVGNITSAWSSASNVATNALISIDEKMGKLINNTAPKPIGNKTKK